MNWSRKNAMVSRELNCILLKIQTNNQISLFRTVNRKKITARGVCNFLSSVLSQQKFKAKDRQVLQPHAISSDGSVYSSMLQLTFIYKAKEYTYSRCECGPTQKT